MSQASRTLRTALIFVFAVGAALFLQFRGQVPTFTILGRGFRPELGSWILSAAPLFILILGLWAAFSYVVGKTCRLSYQDALGLDFPTYFPLLFFALAPLSLVHYLTNEDIQKRMTLLMLAVIFAVLYLKAVQAARIIRERPAPWLLRLRRFDSLPPRRQVLVLFVAAVLIYNGGSLLMMSKGVSFGGDEPHYLLIAHSLLKDGDFDLANNYSQRDYGRFLPPNAVIEAHVLTGTKPGGQYSFHSPGVSILLLPFYALGTLFGKSAMIFLLRFGMSLFGALFGVQMFLFARQEWQRGRLALGLWALFSFTSPVFFYSIHVYPEIIVALFAFTVFRLVRFSPKFSRPRLLLCGLLLSSFIWFHALKYFFILGPLFLYAVWVLIKKHRARSVLAFFLGPIALIFILYFYFQVSIYGSLNPTAVSWQGAMDQQQTVSFLKTLTRIPVRFQVDTLLGYFLDQRDGLLFYAPIYFFAFLGLVELIRRKRQDFWLFLFLTGPYVFVSAFLTQRAGYAPPARPLVAVIWGMAVLVGYFLAYNGKKIFAYLMDFAIGLSFLFVWILCQNPLALYQETTTGTTERGGALFYILSHLHFYLPNILPSFIKIEEWRWTPNFVWPVLLLVFVAAYLLVRKHRFSLKFGHHQVLVASGIALFFLWFVFYPRTVLLSPRKVDLSSGEKLTFYSLSRVAKVKEGGGFALLEDNRDYHFYFATGRPIDKLKVEFGSMQGDYDLKLRFFDAPAFEESTRREIKVKVLDSPPAYRWKRASLYQIVVHLEKRSDVRTGVNPYTLGIQPLR
ncbi:MAG: hypothetical protein NTU60_05985 [Candidatus Aminicenantes bacterium]|nr:hypothetical protein [Candidatus Aminicenantes bacterium]